MQLTAPRISPVILTQIMILNDSADTPPQRAGWADKCRSASIHGEGEALHAVHLADSDLFAGAGGM